MHDLSFLPETLLPLTAAAMPQDLGSSSLWVLTTKRFPHPGLHWRLPPTRRCAGVDAHRLLVTARRKLEISRSGSIYTTEISRPCRSELSVVPTPVVRHLPAPHCAHPLLSPGTPHFMKTVPLIQQHRENTTCVWSIASEYRDDGNHLYSSESLPISIGCVSR